MNKHMNEMSVVRSFNVADFKVTEDERYNVEGHAAVFNQMTSIGGWFNEVIERGAFDECDFSDVSFFVNHDINKIPLARSRTSNSNSTMLVEVDEIGLKVRADLDVDNNVEAKTVHSSINRGDVDGMSFAFRIKEQKWVDLDTEMPTRHVLKIAKVSEVSVVNQPAYATTDISARDKAALENAKNELDVARSLDSNHVNLIEIEKLKTQILMKR